MSEPRSGRRRKAPSNTEWRGNKLYGRKRIRGRLHRWALRTSDVEVARERVKADIERLIGSSYYPGEQRPLYDDIFASWAEQYIMHEVAPRTARRYAVSLKQLSPWLRGLYLDEVDAEKVKQIVDLRRAAGASTATIRRDLTALGSVLKFAEVDENVALDRAHRLKERRDPIVLPEEAHIWRVIERAPGRLGEIIEAAWRTGCRLEELVYAERSKLDHARRQLTVKGKGNKVRVIDLNFDGAYEVFRRVPPMLGCRWIFWHHNAQPYRNLSSRFAALVRAELHAAEKKAELANLQETDFRIFRFHDLRHRHAVDWLKAGRSIYDLQQRLGHASVKTTEIYLKYLTPEEARATMYGLPVELQNERPGR